jgi:hypothetical protein
MNAMHPNDFTTLVSYNLKKGKRAEFMATWKIFNDLKYRFSGSLGARLHIMLAEERFYEYTLWPSKEVYHHFMEVLPMSALAVRAKLRSCCLEIEAVTEMTLLVDELHNESFKGFN